VSKGLMVVVVLLVIVVLIGLFTFGQYVSVKNTLVGKNEAVKAAWSQVDIVLQRRADLIPNLVETVKGYAQQEVTVFGDIAKARSALLSAGSPQEKIAANKQLDGAIVADVVEPVGGAARGRIGLLAVPARIGLRYSVQDAHDAFHDVIDIREITPVMPVVEDLDRLILEHRPCEAE